MSTKIFTGLLLLILCDNSYLQQSVGDADQTGVHSTHGHSDEPIGLSIVVLSQPDAFHAAAAKRFRQRIYPLSPSVKQRLSPNTPAVHLLHERWASVPRAWTIFPILKDLKRDNATWVLICEENTLVNLENLLRTLSKYDSEKDYFIGHELTDKQPVIIHHFSSSKKGEPPFGYPDFKSGFLLSRSLIDTLVDDSRYNRESFAIDAKHELAMAIWNEGEGARLRNDESFCDSRNRNFHCASWYFVDDDSSLCGEPIDEDDLYIAVKTYHGNHDSRIPIIKRTWASAAKHVTYFSDVSDEGIPTVTLGIPNTERGHCAKTMEILKHALREVEGSERPRWVVLVDDDTLLSVRRLRGLLACYDSFHSVALGERYGYGSRPGTGYDYITLGGGMAVTPAALRRLLSPPYVCTCARPEDPDDMILGGCLQRKGVPVTHSPRFHQARPYDYAEGYLAQAPPVSFHNFWNMDPDKAYEDFLRDPTEAERVEL